MQLFALDEKDRLITAHRADKQRNYYCLECKEAVRLRGGLHRQKHFYHTHSTTFCHMQGKSMRHLQVQCHLQRVLPVGDLLLEHPFPVIGRIADAFWVSRKMIFEVQCSPISAEEVQARNRDYESLGLRVIWILHETLYNRIRLTAAEIFLEPLPHYFTNFDKDGNGFIYDQWDIRKNVVRLFKSEKFKVDIREPLGIDRQAHSRAKTWSLHFRGDFLDCLKAEPNPVPERVRKMQRFSTGIKQILQWLKDFYEIGKNLLLEKSSK